ncbi:MAG TPA: hypothetical protein VF189_02510 [Patescibacteria group bacterium]
MSTAEKPGQGHAKNPRGEREGGSGRGSVSAPAERADARRPYSNGKNTGRRA